MSTVIVRDEPSEGVLRLCLNRPATRNALDRELAAALIDAIGSAKARAIVIASTDPRAFCSGLDLSLERDERVAVSDLLYQLYGHMLAAPPIVAAIGGAAVGGGAQLAIAADLRVLGPSAMIRMVGPGHGLAVGAWGLPSLVGRGRAIDLCLTMREVDATEAFAIGLADRLAEDPDTTAIAIAGEIARLDRAAVARAKRIVAEAGGLGDALRRERDENLSTWSGDVADLRHIDG